MKTYLLNIKNTISTFSQGLKLTMLHFFQAKTLRDPIGVKDGNYFEKKEGIVTLQYPFEQLPVPDNGRYQLHNEIDDCIVCDKCAKVCPVNCIDIEPVRAVEEIGKTSDGTPKRIYAAKFDIDMAKCCFCGLCTTVCPTECLTMTKEFDFSTFDLNDHNFVFGNMSDAEVTEKKEEFEIFNKAKQKEKEAKAKPVVEGAAAEVSTEEKKKSVFRPKVKSAGDEAAKKPAFRPKIKAKVEGGEKAENAEGTEKAKKPVFRPKIKEKNQTDEAIEHQDKIATESTEESVKPKKPIFRPKIKVKDQVSEEKKQDSEAKEETDDEVKKSKKPVFRSKIKPKE